MRVRVRAFLWDVPSSTNKDHVARAMELVLVDFGSSVIPRHTAQGLRLRLGARTTKWASDLCGRCESGGLHLPCVMDLCGTEMISGDVFADHNFHHEARQIRSRGAEERLGHESVPTLFFREVENAEEHLNPVMLLQSEVREVQLVLDSVRREFEELKGDS